MAYICDISRERVDTLFEQAFDGVVEEEVRETSEEPRSMRLTKP